MNSLLYLFISLIQAKYHDGNLALSSTLLNRQDGSHFLSSTPHSFMQTRSFRQSSSALYRQKIGDDFTRVPSSSLSRLRDHHLHIQKRRDLLRNKFIQTGVVVDEGRHWKIYDAGVSGQIRLSNLEDSQYVGPVGIGDVGDGNVQMVINAVFDTGSTNLWAASTYCKDETCVERAQFDPTKSVSFSVSQDSEVDGDGPEFSQSLAHESSPAERLENFEEDDLDITFGTGELKGPIGRDRFKMGPYNVHDQYFALIRREIGEVFSEIKFEGILGFAFPSMSARGIPTPFFDSVIEQKVLGGHNEFSFYFTKLPEQTSAIFLGGVDPRFFDGNIKMFPVEQEHYWSLGLHDFRIGNESFADGLDSSKSEFVEGDSSASRVQKLIVDTGTTYFTAPPGIAEQIIDRLPRIRCADINKKDPNAYPDISYVLKDEHGDPFTLTVPNTVYMVSAFGDDECEPAFMSIPVPSEYGPAMLLGEVFMRHWFTVFDRGDGSSGNSWIGFAPAKHSDESLRSLIRERS